MFNPHNTNHPHVQIRQTSKGRGVFAIQDIPQGALIAEFFGDVFLSNAASKLPSVMVDHALQIGPTQYVHAPNSLAEIINHSCDPCAGIHNFKQVVTIRDVQKGEEITWDYAMTEMSDWRLDNCLCGSSRCRGTIGSFLDLPNEVKQEYLSKGIVSEWIIKELSLSE